MLFWNRSCKSFLLQTWFGLGLCASAPNALGQNECESLDGTYEYYGQVLHGQQPSHYMSSLTRYFGFDAGQVLKPKYVVVTTDPLQDSVVLVDVLGHAILAKGVYSGRRIELPKPVQLVCQSGRWFREYRYQGGVDGAYNETEQKIFLERQQDGNILVDAHEKFVSGFFFKKISEHHYELLFQRVEDSARK